jgi:hypothetical protein
MLSQRFFSGFTGKKHSRPAKKKTTVVFETLEPRLAMAGVSNADSSVVLIDAALMVDIPWQELAGSRVIAIDSRRDAIDQISTALAGLSEIDVVRVISYGSAVVVAQNKYVFDGMNEKGLAAHALALASNYGDRDPSRNMTPRGARLSLVTAGALTAGPGLRSTVTFWAECHPALPSRRRLR